MQKQNKAEDKARLTLLKTEKWKKTPRRRNYPEQCVAQKVTQNMPEDKPHQRTPRYRAHTSVWPRRDRKIRAGLKGVSRVRNSLAVSCAGVGEWVSPGLWLAKEPAGRGLVYSLGTSGWGANQGEKKNQPRFLFLGGGYLVFGYERSCWRVVSAALVSQGRTGAKVNYHAGKARTHTQTHTSGCLGKTVDTQDCKRYPKILYFLLEQKLKEKKKHWSVRTSLLSEQHLRNAKWVDCSCITSSGKGAEARSSAGGGHAIEFPTGLVSWGAVKSSCKQLRAPRGNRLDDPAPNKTGVLTECWHIQLLFHTE